MTRDELYRLKDELLAQLADGLRAVNVNVSASASGVHQRLDLLNGRTLKSELALAGQAERMAAQAELLVRLEATAAARTLRLETEVEEMRVRADSVASAKATVDRAAISAEDRPALTRREWSLIWSVALAIGSIVSAFLAFYMTLKGGA